MSSVRDEIYAALSGRTEITDVVPADHIHGAGSLTEAPNYEPFLMFRLEEETPVFSTAATYQDVQVYVHDRGGGRMRTDTLLQEVRAAMLGIPNTGEIVSVVWQGDSPDTPDDALNTSARFASFRIMKKGN